MIVELQSNEKDNIELGSDSNLNSSAMDDTSMSSEFSLLINILYHMKDLFSIIFVGRGVCINI